MRTITIDDLKLDVENARVHSVENLRAIEDSIGRVGVGRSVVIDEDGKILAGNATVQAAAARGIERVHVIETAGDVLVAVRRSGLTDEQKKHLAYADNRASELASWSIPQISADMAAGFDLTPIWSREELDELVASLEPPPSESGKSRSRPEPGEEDAHWGYAIETDAFTGRALLDNRRQGGMELVKRLKGLPEDSWEEADFWAAQIARMAKQSKRHFDKAMYPPATGKYAVHLAEKLAGGVAKRLGLPDAFKAVDGGDYGDAIIPGESLLVVDDCYLTGATMACVAAASEARLYLACLCRG